MIKCTCCCETKYTAEFTYSTGYGWAKHCRECGVWLRLLREAFGPVRDVERNQEMSRYRMRKIRNEPVLALQRAWGIGA